MPSVLLNLLSFSKIQEAPSHRHLSASAQNFHLQRVRVHRTSEFALTGARAFNLK